MIIALLLASATAAARQQEAPATPDKPGPDKSEEYPAVYRVEVIVFRHADGRSDRSRVAEPVDYTDHIDPLLVATANELAERRLAELARVVPPVAISTETDETTPFLQTEDETIRPIPPVYSALGDLSTPTQRAMSRLIGAPQYETLVARAWIQLAPRDQDTVAMRLHDRIVVDTTDPVGGESPLLITPQPLRTDVLPVPPLNETTALPLEIYQLDGTVRLRRSRFLHLDLDLVWQEPARALADRLGADYPQADGLQADGRPWAQRSRPTAEQPDADADNGWHLHRLQQSRIVEPGRLEYFDSSLLGVLVRIERFDQVVPEVEPAVGPEADQNPIEQPEPGTTTPDDAPDESGRPVTNSGG